MRLSRPLALAAAAALVAGVAAYAESPQVHVLRIALPDGGTELVRYTGDVAPNVVLAADPLDAPFAPFDRIAAMMDAQASAMMRQVAALSAAPATAAPDGDVRLAVLADAPAGGRYTSVSTTTIDGHSCTTSVESVSQGAGKPSRLLRRVSGDGCDAVVRASAAVPMPPTPPAPELPKAPVADTI